MARDRGQIYEASDWFKEALQINQVRRVMKKISLYTLSYNRSSVQYAGRLPTYDHESRLLITRLL